MYKDRLDKIEEQLSNLEDYAREQALENQVITTKLDSLLDMVDTNYNNLKDNRVALDTNRTLLLSLYQLHTNEGRVTNDTLHVPADEVTFKGKSYIPHLHEDTLDYMHSLASDSADLIHEGRDKTVMDGKAFIPVHETLMDSLSQEQQQQADRAMLYYVVHNGNRNYVVSLDGDRSKTNLDTLPTHIVDDYIKYYCFILDMASTLDLKVTKIYSNDCTYYLKEVNSEQAKMLTKYNNEVTVTYADNKPQGYTLQV